MVLLRVPIFQLNCECRMLSGLFGFEVTRKVRVVELILGSSPYNTSFNVDKRASRFSDVQPCCQIHRLIKVGCYKSRLPVNSNVIRSAQKTLFSFNFAELYDLVAYIWYYRSFQLSS